MEKIRQIFIQHVKLHRKSAQIPANVEIYSLNALTSGLRSNNVLFDHLKNEKMITSYAETPSGHTLSLTESYIDSLKSSPEMSLKPPPEMRAFLDYINKNKKTAGPNGCTFNDDGFGIVIEKDVDYVEMCCVQLEKFDRGAPDDREWLDYMVQEKHIKKWHVTPRNRMCYVWL